MRVYRRQRRSPYVGTHLPAVLEARGGTFAWLCRRMTEYESSRGTPYTWRKSHVSGMVHGRFPISAQFVAAASAVLGLPPELLFIRPDEPQHAVA